MTPDPNLRPDDDESKRLTRRSLIRTSFFGLGVLGLGASLSACGGDDDDDDDVNDAVNTVESEGGDAVDDVQDGAGDAVDDVEDGADDAVDEVEDGADDVATEVDS